MPDYKANKKKAEQIIINTIINIPITQNPVSQPFIEF